MKDVALCACTGLLAVAAAGLTATVAPTAFSCLNLLQKPSTYVLRTAAFRRPARFTKHTSFSSESLPAMPPGGGADLWISSGLKARASGMPLPSLYQNSSWLGSATPLRNTPCEFPRLTVMVTSRRKESGQSCISECQSKNAQLPVHWRSRWNWLHFQTSSLPIRAL